MDHDDTTALTTELTNQIFYNDGDTLFFYEKVYSINCTSLWDE